MKTRHGTVIIPPVFWKGVRYAILVAVVVFLVILGSIVKEEIIQALSIIGLLLLVLTGFTVVPKGLGRLAEAVDRQDHTRNNDQKKLDQMKAALAYEGEREKSRGKEGESYMWNFNG